MSGSVMGDGLTPAQAGLLVQPGYPAAHGAWQGTAVTNVTVPAANTLYVYRVPVFKSLRATLLRIFTVTGGAGSEVKFALWANDPATARPTGVPLAGQDVGLATTANNSWQDVVLASVFLPGNVGGLWFGSKFTGTLPIVRGVTSQSSHIENARFPAGSAPTTNLNNFSLASPYADNIMLTNLTGAALTNISGIVPACYLEWA